MDTFTMLDSFLGEASSGVMSLFELHRTVFIERLDVDHVTVSFRNTRLLEASRDGTLRLSMFGWYTENSVSILNTLLPATVQLRTYTPPNENQQRPPHEYIMLAGAVSPSAGAARESYAPFLERSDTNGIVVQRTPRSAADGAPIYQLPHIEGFNAVILWNNQTDDLIDTYLGETLPELLATDGWEQFAIAMQADIERNFSMRPVDVTTMLRRGLLDAPVVLAALRFDAGDRWRAAAQTILATRDLRALRNALRVFFFWFCLTGPLLVRRGSRPRPLGIEERQVFEA